MRVGRHKARGNLRTKSRGKKSAGKNASVDELRYYPLEYGYVVLYGSLHEFRPINHAMGLYLEYKLLGIIGSKETAEPRSAFGPHLRHRSRSGTSSQFSPQCSQNSGLDHLDTPPSISSGSHTNSI
jgi:hypothetical protein